MLIDWSQNHAAKTTIAPYSLRAQPFPTVSTPLTWDEVEVGAKGGGAQLRFLAADVLERVESFGDLFAPLDAPASAARRPRPKPGQPPSAGQTEAVSRSDQPAGESSRLSIVLTPGASAGREQSALVAIDDALTPEGVQVERIDFPYRLAGRRAPDRQPVLVATVVAAAAAVAGDLAVTQDQIALGGRSMGGRMCSIAVAEGLPAAALVLVSYPLHPPGKPRQAPGRASSGRSRCRACSFLARVISSARPRSSSRRRRRSPGP